MMRGRTRLNADQAGPRSCEELQHLGARHTLADHHRARSINAVNLKHRFRNIETNRDNFAHGRLPSLWFALTQPPFGTSMPQSGRRPQHQEPTFLGCRAMSAILPKATTIAMLIDVG